MATAIVETPTARTEDRNGALQERIVLDARIPPGPIEQRWDRCRFDMKLVNPANRRKHTILVVGSGLAGAAAAATLGEQGYHVHCFSFHDTPRRAHSIAAQGGINAAKNYRNDGDSVFRLFYDTVKGGDFRAREANAYRLAQVSVNIIDQCVAQGVPFARDYGGLLETRSFGGVQVERTFYARGQTGQQLLVGAYRLWSSRSPPVRTSPQAGSSSVVGPRWCTGCGTSSTSISNAFCTIIPGSARSRPASRPRCARG